VTKLAVGLLDRGVDLLVVSLDNAVERELVLSGPHLRVLLGPYRGHGHGRARDAFRAERAYVRDALRRERPDLAHAHWTYEYALGSLASGVPTLVTVRDWAPTMLRLSPDPYRAVRLVMHAVTLTRGRHFTVTSPYMRAKVRRWARVTVPVIPNALEEESFAEWPRPTRPVRPPVLVAVNDGFSRRKNVATLLEAFALVREDVRGCRLRLVGSGYASYGPARRWALARGLEPGVEFVGPLSHAEAVALLRDADVFVHPSLEESFGMVIVEAMAQGLPVVAGARSGAVPWVVGGGTAGVLVDVTSARALADGILGLLADHERRERLASAGYARAWDTFRVSRVVDRYLEVYGGLTSGATGSTSVVSAGRPS
jgi:glycosyltransferase involved in cell wall biosynthesis